jgi:hypothetical protein
MLGLAAQFASDLSHLDASLRPACCVGVPSVPVHCRLELYVPNSVMVFSFELVHVGVFQGGSKISLRDPPAKHALALIFERRERPLEWKEKAKASPCGSPV